MVQCDLQNVVRPHLSSVKIFNIFFTLTSILVIPALIITVTFAVARNYYEDDEM